jgi:hypothetical protein
MNEKLILKSDRYWAGHPPIATGAKLSVPCFVDARELAPTGDKGTMLCLKC